MGTRRSEAATPETRTSLRKTPTGIRGLDQITDGGLPTGRPTLVCGAAGSGKTLFGMEFLVRGGRDFGEPGVMITFEEREPDLVQNVASLGFDVPALIARDLLRIDEVRVDRAEIAETGEYDLEGLFVRIGAALDEIGAKRILIDTIEALFTGLTNQDIVRSELNRLFRWLKERGITAVITAERGSATLTRHGLEEYVSDCVITLDHRVDEQISTRRLRIVKYRGAVHGTNEYPFLIDDAGMSILPITAAGLTYGVSSERTSLGVPAIDAMLGGGCYRGSSILITGTAGTGKTSLAAIALDAACRRGERALLFSFEESPAQLVRNLGSIGISLQPWLDRGLLVIRASRPTVHGLERHLLETARVIEQVRPALVAVDPISNLRNVGTPLDVSGLLVRLLDDLKHRGITAILTHLSRNDAPTEYTVEGISSLMDTWIVLRDDEVSGARRRSILVLKSRGTAHSSRVHPLAITARGLSVEAPAAGAQPDAR